MCNCSHCDHGTQIVPPVVVYVDLSAVMNRLDTLEAMMATEAEQLAALEAKLDDLIADVRAGAEALRAEVSDEGQVILDRIVAKVDAFDAEVGDGDGSDTPPTEPPVEPTA